MRFLSSLPLFIIALITLLTNNAALAQCPTCVPDQSCISTDGFPAVCPLVPADATAGVYYEEQITFYMPTTIIDPGTGVEATLVDVSISSVTGMPYGLQFTLNDADGVFHPSAGDNFGCATICGIPLLPGSYDININVVALVSVFGFEASQTQTFVSTLLVLPGEGSAETFSYDNIAGCGSVEVNYDALLSFPAPSVTTYSWDFGNNTASTDASPSTVLYDTPGTYTSILTTTVSDFALHGVGVSNLSNNWSGDIDDLIDSADPYFVVSDANGNAVYTSATINNTTNTNWEDPNLPLSSPPYSIQFFDEDAISQDDDLGTYSFDLIEGENSFNIGNGTVGIITITLDPTTSVTDSTTITVFSGIDAAITQSGNVLSLGSSSASSISWYQNGVLLTDATGNSYTMTEGGLYYCVVTNEFGCSATSNSVLYCPQISITYDQNAQELSVPEGFVSYQWFFNGLPLDGANSFYYSTTQAGNYAVDIVTDYGCEITSVVFTLVVSVEQVENDNTTLFPNPAEGFLFIKSSRALVGTSIQTYDIMGNLVLSSQPKWNDQSGGMDVSSLRPGVYFSLVNGKRFRWIKK